ncbi:Tenascin-R [Holothuria leucospilota]|uniref:Tenascin-R n=1 Tax=Holothuria leucospilota TaxID=206669 RepID=A0A9Q1BUS7_HOLLE|nr:Tenascin-R [Holothuria leucospilota]
MKLVVKTMTIPDLAKVLCQDEELNKLIVFSKGVMTTSLFTEANPSPPEIETTIILKLVSLTVQFVIMALGAWDLWTSDKGLCPLTVYFQCFLIIKAAALWYMQFVRMGQWSSAILCYKGRPLPQDGDQLHQPGQRKAPPGQKLDLRRTLIIRKQITKWGKSWCSCPPDKKPGYATASEDLVSKCVTFTAPKILIVCEGFTKILIVFDRLVIENELNGPRIFSLAKQRGNPDPLDPLDPPLGFDYFAYHKHRPFTTRDRDNDAHNTENCAATHHDAWWFGGCYNMKLNGDYQSSSQTGVCVYDSVNRHQCRIRYTEMKIRRKQKDG